MTINAYQDISQQSVFDSRETYIYKQLHSGYMEMVNMRNYARKSIVVCAIGLLLCIGIMPSLAFLGVYHDEMPVEINEYRADGSVVTTTVYISEEKIQALITFYPLYFYYHIL